MDKKRFKALWARCRNDGTADGGGEAFAELVRHYSQSHRRYHTPVHINHCLNQFAAASSLLALPDAVELAVWFHDVIYDVPTVGNEQRSAEFYLHCMGDAAPEALNQAVYQLIMVTDHRQLPVSDDEKFMVDIDLSSFGLPLSRMLRDSVDVRGEFPSLGDDEFYPAQLKFLQSLLERDHFCFTSFFRERHEQSARDNIAYYIQGLRDKGLVPT